LNQLGNASDACQLQQAEQGDHLLEHFVTSEKSAKNKRRCREEVEQEPLFEIVLGDQFRPSDRLSSVHIDIRLEEGEKDVNCEANVDYNLKCLQPGAPRLEVLHSDEGNLQGQRDSVVDRQHYDKDIPIKLVLVVVSDDEPAWADGVLSIRNLLRLLELEL